MWYLETSSARGGSVNGSSANGGSVNNNNNNYAAADEAFQVEFEVDSDSTEVDDLVRGNSAEEEEEEEDEEEEGDEEDEDLLGEEVRRTKGEASDIFTFSFYCCG